MPENTGPPTAEEIAAMKDRNPDTMLFFRDGDTYRVYGDDAIKLWAILIEIEEIIETEEIDDVTIQELTIGKESIDSTLANVLATGMQAAVVERVANHAENDPSPERIVTPERIDR